MNEANAARDRSSGKLGHYSSVAGHRSNLYSAPAFTRRSFRGDRRWRLSDLVIVLGVIAFEWLPFIPMVDFQSIKGIKPPLIGGGLSVPEIVLHAAVLLVGGVTLSKVFSSNLRGLLLALLTLSTLVAARVFFVTDGWDQSVLVGALTGISLTSLIWRSSESKRAWIFMSVIFAALAVGALWPFEFKTYRTDFGWIPFADFLSRDIVGTARGLLGQAVLLFSLFVVIDRMRGELVAATWVLGLLVLSIEWARCYLSVGNGGITSVIVVVIVAVLVRMLHSTGDARRVSHAEEARVAPSRSGERGSAATSGDYRPQLTLATLAYVAVVAYGTLFSTVPWRVPAELHFLTWEGLHNASRADMLENVLGYIPLGLLLALRLSFSLSRGAAISATICGGLLLSLCLEMIQVFVPGRQSSVIDVVMNTIGTSLGAVGGALLGSRQSPTRLLVRIRNAWFAPGLVGDLGVAVVALWIVSQVSPFIPTIDVATVRLGLSSAWHKLQDPALLNLSQAFTYACYLSALGILWSSTARNTKAGVGTYSMLVLPVLLLKPFFLGRELSLEALIGFSASVPLIAIQTSWTVRARGMLGAVMLCVGFAVYELVPSVGPTHPFNWVPFRGEITNTLNGLMGMTGLIWIFFSLGALIRVWSPPYQNTRYALLGGVAVIALVSLCEWFQQVIPGRYGDITAIGIAVVGWSAAWGIRQRADTTK